MMVEFLWKQKKSSFQCALCLKCIIGSKLYSMIHLLKKHKKYTISNNLQIDSIYKAFVIIILYIYILYLFQLWKIIP